MQWTIITTITTTMEAVQHFTDVDQVFNWNISNKLAFYGFIIWGKIGNFVPGTFMFIDL